MSATLGDITLFEEALTSYRPRTTVTSAARPVPLHAYSELTPVHKTPEKLVASKQVPVYVVHLRNGKRSPAPRTS